MIGSNWRYSIGFILSLMSVVLGAFYSEVGNELLKQFRKVSYNSQQLGEMLKITRDWKDTCNFKSDFRFNLNSAINHGEHGENVYIKAFYKKTAD